jgi:hypothetical protein
MQINIFLFSFTNMNTKYMVIIGVLAVMMIGALATTDSVFAYEKSQAVSQVNDCGNGELPLNVGCQNTASQIQGDGNEAALASEQAFEGESNNVPAP